MRKAQQTQYLGSGRLARSPPVAAYRNTATHRPLTKSRRASNAIVSSNRLRYCINEGLISSCKPTCSNTARLFTCGARKGASSNIRHPDLHRPQALLPQTLPMCANLIARCRRIACHGPPQLHVTYPTEALLSSTETTTTAEFAALILLDYSGPSFGSVLALCGSGCSPRLARSWRGGLSHPRKVVRQA